MNTTLSFKENLSKANSVVRSDGNKTIKVCLIFGACYAIPSQLILLYMAQHSIVPFSINNAWGDILAVWALMLIQMFITLLFFYGLSVHALKYLRGGEPRIADVFDGFGRPLFKILGASILLILLLFGCIMSFFILFGIAGTIVGLASHNQMIVGLFGIVGGIFGIIVSAILLIMFSLYEYRIYDDKTAGVGDILRCSRDLTKGTRLFVFRLLLFYFGLSCIVSALFCGIPRQFGWVGEYSPLYAALCILAFLFSARFICPRAVIAGALYYETVRKRYEEAQASNAIRIPGAPTQPAK